jgi:hypothetical protein
MVGGMCTPSILSALKASESVWLIRVQRIPGRTIVVLLEAGGLIMKKRSKREQSGQVYTLDAAQFVRERSQHEGTMYVRLVDAMIDQWITADEIGRRLLRGTPVSEARDAVYEMAQQGWLTIEIQESDKGIAIRITPNMPDTEFNKLAAVLLSQRH